jgi:hypothetical protein
MLARYGDRLTAGMPPRALVTATGRVIATRPVGWLASDRLNICGGGALTIGQGIGAVAEPLGHGDAFLVCGTEAPAPTKQASTPLRLRLLGRDRGEAEPGGAGEPLTLRMRHAEILTLLCSKPEGLTSEELSLGVYGTSDRAGSIRVEISRLRKLLGDCIETEHYRLRGGVGSDVADVIGLLHRGHVREAAARYQGPLLPRSRAPGVVREREALEGWMRQSVMSCGDREALWGWLETASGGFDVAAWQRLLANLPFQDPRRSLAASRLAQLRTDRN